MLTLPEEPVQPRYTTRVFSRVFSTPWTEALSAWQFHVDERLEDIPSYFEEPAIDLMIEWVYMIDLDRELVRIKSQGPEASFKLQCFPRQLQWAEDFYMESDEEDNNMLAKSPVGQPFESLLTPAPSSRSLLNKYAALKVTKAKPKTVVRPSADAEHVYVVRELLLKQFIETWNGRLSQHILLCRAGDFIYQEVVFAILSLASGHFQLLADQSPVGRDRMTYNTAHLGSPYGSNILPDFGSGMHRMNALPGSAPDSSIYWFKGVVILLIDSQIDGDGLKAAIARLTEFGKESGRKIFDGLVTNVRSFMLVRVNGPDVVQHTEMIDLIPRSNLSAPVQDDPELPPSHEMFLPVSVSAQGFNIMVTFFQTVELYALKPYKPVANVLPNELYDKIIGMVDPNTYMKCAQVSEPFQHYVHRHIRLSWLNHPQQEETDSSHHIIKGLSPITSNLIMYDTIEARDIEIRLLPWGKRKTGSRWVPVIGNDDRASMIIECAINCPAFVAHDIPTVEDHQPDVDEMDEVDDPGKPAFLTIEDSWGRRMEKFGSTHFYIPKFAGVKDTSRAWDNYLDKLLRPPERGQQLSWSKRDLGHGFMLPRNTSCIHLEQWRWENPLRDASGQIYDEFSGLVWIKKPADFEPKIMAQSLTEAQHFLSSPEIAESAHKRATRRGFLIIAFGSKVQLFEWDFHENDHPGDVLPMLVPSENGVILNISIKDERERFEKLFGKFREQAEAARAIEDAVKQDEKDADLGLEEKATVNDTDTAMAKPGPE